MLIRQANLRLSCSHLENTGFLMIWFICFQLVLEVKTVEVRDGEKGSAL